MYILHVCSSLSSTSFSISCSVLLITHGAVIFPIERGSELGAVDTVSSSLNQSQGDSDTLSQLWQSAQQPLSVPCPRGSRDAAKARKLHNKVPDLM